MNEHGVHPPIPAIEVSNHADPLRVGRPYREKHARDTFDFKRMGAQGVISAPQAAFIEQIQVVVRNLERKSVGVIGFIQLPLEKRIAAFDAQKIRNRRKGGAPPFKNSVGMHPGHPLEIPSNIHPYIDCVGIEHADQAGIPFPAGAEVGKRSVQPRRQQCVRQQTVATRHDVS